jgi:hypothetical protein
MPLAIPGNALEEWRITQVLLSPADLWEAGDPACEQGFA